MSRAKVKIKVKSSNKKSGTLLASVPIAVVKNDNPSGERMYQTRAELITHIRRGTRPKTFRPRRAR